MGSPLMDDFAAIAPRVSGSISFVASSLIIYLIRRSKTKLSIIYHRIMFGMSTADILSSFAMALTTLPMVKSGERFTYHRGTQLGNIHTCRAQGFIVTFGLSCTMAYNASLCVYYACAIGFQMKEFNIQRKVEPYLHIVPIACGLIPSVFALSIDYINNTGWEAWCTVKPPPHSTFQHYEKFISYVIAIPLSLIFLIIMGSFALILIRVYRTEKRMKTGKTDVTQNDALLRRSPAVVENLRKAEKSHSNSKILFRQALAYILALMTSTSMAFLKQVPYFKDRSVQIDDKIFVCLLPLQGFFNFLIFVAHKVNNYRRIHPNVSRLTVLKMLFFEADEVDDEVLFSRISLVSINENEEIERIYVSNEFEDEEYDLSYGGDEGGDIDERQDVYEDNDHDLDCDEEKVEETQSSHHSIHQGLGQVVSGGGAGGSLVSYPSQSSRGVKSSFGLSDGISFGISTLDSGEKGNHARQNDGNSFLKGLQHAG